MGMNQDAIERTLESFHPASYGWALACCRGNHEEAQEVLQTSYLKVVEGRATFRGESSPRTWFFGVVKRTAQERRRLHAVKRLAQLRWFRGVDAAEPMPTPEGLSEDAERRQQFRGLLSQLSRRQREVLHLVFYQEMSIEQAGKVLGLSVGTARTHYERGKRELRKMLSGAGEGTWKKETIAT